MSNFDLTFFKVYIYAKGWPVINLGASHESCAHPSIQVQLNTKSMLERVPLEVRDQNFMGATYRKLKSYGCLAPIAPVLAWSLLTLFAM